MTQERAIYASDCMSIESVCNPLVGHSLGMQVLGFFDKVTPSSEKAYVGDNIHISRGGLEKTISNGGIICCKNANNLFSMAGGAISIRICLPDYDIVNGVYGGLGRSKSVMEDYVLFGVNLGEHYISQPGIYGALTKDGIEFTIWSSGERNTLIATGVNVLAGKDIVLTFSWNGEGMSEFTNSESTSSESVSSDKPNMRIVANGIVYEKNATIKNDSLSQISFWLLDTPYRKSDLHIIVRRIEIFSYNTQGGTLPITSDPIRQIGVASLRFSIIASKGPNVKIDSPSFSRVVAEDIDMRAIGPTGSSYLHKSGQDVGVKSVVAFPAPVIDLPPGFIETRGPSYE